MQGFIGLLYLLGRHIAAMGVQLLYHALDGILHQLLFVDAVNIEIIDSHLGNLQLAQGGFRSQADGHLSM